MTPKQYMGIIRRTKGCPSDIKSQTSLWPYPQASQSYLEIWRASWPHEEYEMPPGRLQLPLTGSDKPGIPVQMAKDIPTPSQAIKLLLEV